MTGGSAPARVFLTAEWRNLVLLNFAIDPEILRGRVPGGTELDAWNGTTFVSVVGFHFRDTRVLGWAIPFHRDFEEVNLRFYVRREVGGEVRRGVVFVKELVPRTAIALVARWIYGERYEARPMRHADERDPDGRGRMSYGWDEASHVSLVARGPGAVPEPGSEEEFITEHYWGYAAQRDGGTLEYQVEHPCWRVWMGEKAELRCDVASLYGREFVEALRARPSSAFLADGSPVVVRRGRRL